MLCTLLTYTFVVHWVYLSCSLWAQYRVCFARSQCYKLASFHWSDLFLFFIPLWVSVGSVHGWVRDSIVFISNFYCVDNLLVILIYSNSLRTYCEDSWNLSWFILTVFPTLWILVIWLSLCNLNYCSHYWKYNLLMGAALISCIYFSHLFTQARSASSVILWVGTNVCVSW